MRLSKSAVLVPLLLLGAAPLIAQEGGAEQNPQGKEKTQPDPRPVFIDAALGAKAAVNGVDGQPLGTIHDHVIDRKSGRVGGVVLKAELAGEARLVLVPFGRFVWDAAARQLRADISKEELERMPEFEPVEDGDAPEKGNSASAPKTLASTEVLRSKVLAEKDPFGTVSGLVLEPSRGTIAFLLVKPAGQGSDPYVVPWQAATWDSKAPAEGALQCAVAMAPDKLSGAPRLEGGDTRSLETDPTLLKGIYAFYGVEQPFRTREAGFGR